MDKRIEKLLMYGLPLWVLLAFFALHPSLGKSALNSMMAFAGLTLAGITFIIGPLSRFSKTVNRLKIYRKYLGLSSFVFMVAHAALAIVNVYGLDIPYMLSPDNPRMLQVYSAVIAFLIFFLMSVTSSVKAIRLLGARNWKLIQTTGYVAMALAMLHFALANTAGGVFNLGRLYAELVFVFGIIVILARVLVLVLAHLDESSRRK